MAHKEQRDFCEKVKKLYSNHFKKIRVLDIGSLDINGNNRYLFEGCEYTGIDVGAGKNVDVVCKAHMHKVYSPFYNTIISTECFEHDMYLERTLKKVCEILKEGGLFLFTCATEGRKEHGTKATSKHDSPFTYEMEGWQDYYKNVTSKMIKGFIDINYWFPKHHFEINRNRGDLYFYGIKR